MTPPRWPRDAQIVAVQQWIVQHGRRPTRAEFATAYGLPSRDTVVQKFGSMTRFWEAFMRTTGQNLPPDGRSRRDRHPAPRSQARPTCGGCALDLSCPDPVSREAEAAFVEAQIAAARARGLGTSTPSGAPDAPEAGTEGKAWRRRAAEVRLVHSLLDTAVLDALAYAQMVRLLAVLTARQRSLLGAS